jgi:hypothetical protein
MRVQQERSGTLISYVSAAERIPKAHPLQQVRQLADQALDRFRVFSSVRHGDQSEFKRSISVYNCYKRSSALRLLPIFLNIHAILKSMTAGQSSYSEPEGLDPLLEFQEPSLPYFAFPTEDSSLQTGLQSPSVTAYPDVGPARQNFLDINASELFSDLVVNRAKAGSWSYDCGCGRSSEGCSQDRKGISRFTINTIAPAGMPNIVTWYDLVTYDSRVWANPSFDLVDFNRRSRSAENGVDRKFSRISGAIGSNSADTFYQVFNTVDGSANGAAEFKASLCCRFYSFKEGRYDCTYKIGLGAWLFDFEYPDRGKDWHLCGDDYTITIPFKTAWVDKFLNQPPLPPC